MRFSEFLIVPEDNTKSENAFKALLMMFRQKADSSNKPSEISWRALETYMNNMGHSMTFDAFKNLYDQKPELQSLVSDYDENGVTINTRANAPAGDDPVEIPPDEKVSQMAKRALNKRGGEL
jgi:hypothetical protein